MVDETTRDRLIAEHPSSAEVLKPLLRGKDIKRWIVEPRNLWLIFTRRGVDIKKYPAIENYLTQYNTQLMPGTEGGRKPGTYEWYEIQDNVAYWREFEQPKIIWPGISAEITAFALDEAGHYGNDNNQIIICNDMTLLGILNCRLTRFFLQNICDKVQGDSFRLKMIYIAQIPILETESMTDIKALVKRILAAKTKDPKANVTKLENQN